MTDAIHDTPGDDITSTGRGVRSAGCHCPGAPGTSPEGWSDEDFRDFVRDDEAEECWRIVDPVLATWREGRPELLEYPAGSSGPD